MYLERLSVFDYANNPYYVPNGKFNTHSSTDDIALPNCTTYCFLRMQEASEQSKRQNNWIKSSGGFGNAKTWYETTTLPKGTELREGSIAVFDGNCGHVAFVEIKIDDTHAIITESNYDEDKSLRNRKFFDRREAKLVVGEATLSGVGKLIGYIYIPINDKRVQRDTTKNQVQIIEDFINVRKGPNGDLWQKGCYCPQGIYNYLDKQYDGTYYWYELDNNMWVREGEWTTEYPISQDYESLYKEAIEKLDLIKNKLKEIEDILC